MIIEEGFILLAAAQMNSTEAHRNGWSQETIFAQTMKLYSKLREELKKPEYT